MKKNGSPVQTRNTNKQFRVINYENKFIEWLQSISCLTSKILLQITTLQKKRENCGGEPERTTFATVT